MEETRPISRSYPMWWHNIGYTIHFQQKEFLSEEECLYTARNTSLDCLWDLQIRHT